MIWLTGYKGMLGRDVESIIRRAGLPLLSSDLEVDITDPAALEAFLSPEDRKAITWIINCSAYTAVDRAEEEKEKAFSINGRGVENLALVAGELQVPVIHISTDYVFDGKKNGPYREDDPAGPVSVYGMSKLEGEERLRRTWANHYILRTSWLYGKNGSNFIYTMLKLFKSRPGLKIVADQKGTPTYAGDLAAAILKLIQYEEGSGKKHYGIYHYSNSGETTWYDYAKEISRLAAEFGLIEKEIPLEPVTSAEYPTPAKRPSNSLFSKDKIMETFSLSIRSWREALADFLKHEVKNA